MKKLKKLLAVVIPILAMFEGVQHIIFSSISFWGIFSTHVTDWRVWVNPVADFFFGFVNIGIGLFWKGGEKHGKRVHKRKSSS